MRFRSLILFLYFFSVPVAFVACDSEKITPDPQEYDSQIGIVGEINNIQSSRMAVYYAGNLTKGTLPVVIQDASLSLESRDDISVNFIMTDQKSYRPEKELRIVSGQQYTLRCLKGDTNYTAQLLIPDSFLLDAGITGDTIVTMTLQPATTSKYNYVVEFFGETQSGQTYPIYVKDAEPVTDNYIYSELPDNVNKVFIRSRQGIVKTRVHIVKPFHENIRVKVRSVGDMYYTYLYNSEIQNGHEKYDVPLPCNLSKGAIGFVGAAFIRSVRL